MAADALLGVKGGGSHLLFQPVSCLFRPLQGDRKFMIAALKYTNWWQANFLITGKLAKAFMKCMRRLGKHDEATEG